MAVAANDVETESTSTSLQHNSGLVKLDTITEGKWSVGVNDECNVVCVMSIARVLENACRDIYTVTLP